MKESFVVPLVRLLFDDLTFVQVIILFFSCALLGICFCNFGIIADARLLAFMPCMLLSIILIEVVLSGLNLYICVRLRWALVHW